MTQPIDIPVKRSRLQATTLERSIFPPDEGPYFGYIELFGSGHVYHALSSGSGKYVEIGARCSLPTLSFIVEKDRFSKRITVEITSLGLQQAVGIAIQQHPTSFAPLELDFNTILSKYEALKNHLVQLRERYPYDDVTAEMQLLVESLLLERALYDGMNMDALRQRQILCAMHLQDIHARNVSNGLNEIEDCFELGLVPDHDTEKYLEALNLRYADLARSGNYAELRNLCEPIARSGEIELQYDQSLLLEVLDSGYLDVYQYMLDLIDRTKKPNLEIQDSQYPDVTYDPMYVAIRLGQVEAVRHLIGDDHETFEGYVQDDVQGPIDKDRVFTPLYAATYWNQQEIARLLLNTGPVYFAGMPQATALAQQNGLMDMLHLFLEYPQPSTPATFVYDMLPQPPSAQFQFVVSPQNLQLPLALSSSPPGSVKSVSGITNALSGFDSGTGFQPASFASTSTLGPSTQSQPFMPLEFSSPPAMSLLAELEFANTYSTANAVFEPFTQPHVSLIRHTSTYKARQQLGRNLLRRLEGRCNRLRALCRRHPTSDAYSEVEQCFNAAKVAWKSGIDRLRDITRNKAPCSLVDVLLLLFVADALGCHLTHAGEDLELEFANDLGRWRTLLQGLEKTMFDEIVCAVWDIESVPMLDIPKNDACELYRFQELIQNLISSEEMRPIKTRSSGSRLQTVQQQLKRRKCKTGRMRGRASRPPIQPVGSFQSIGSVLGRLTHDTDEFHEDDLDLGEFIDLDALGGELFEPEVAPSKQAMEPATGWKDVQPIVVLVLASVAFSIVLTTVSVIQDGPEERRSMRFPRAAPGYGRSCAIVEGFLSFQPDENSYDSGIDVQLASEEWSSPYIREMKKASQRNSRIPSLDPAGGKSARLTAAASMSSPSGSSFMSTDFSSPDTARTKERRAKCASCHKTFSSISNRNKHMREGCSKIERMGYKCGNEQCKKVLTTKWYRDRHEQTRCRFR